MEKDELRGAVEGAESRVQIGEVRVASCLIEIAIGKQEVDRVGFEKDEEIMVSLSVA